VCTECARHLSNIYEFWFTQ